MKRLTEFIVRSLSVLFVFATLALCASCGDTLEKVITNALEDGKLNETEVESIMQEYKVFMDGEEPDVNNVIREILDVAELNDIEISEEDIKAAFKVKPDKSPVVHIYLDNTESMKGYINTTDAAQFTSVFTALNDLYSQAGTPINAYLTSQDKKSKVTTVDAVDFDKLRDDLIAHKMKQFTDSYQLKDFFADVVNRILKDTVNNSICFFVTDGIPSGSNEQINNSPDRSYNYSSKTELSSDIATALRPLAANGKYGAAVFRFVAPYKGEYWKLNNNHSLVLKDDYRPFYVIAVGYDELLASFVDKVENGLSLFKPEEQVVFLPQTEELVPLCYYMNKIDGKEGHYALNIDLFMEEIGEGNVEMYFSTKALPTYLRDTTMLASAIKLEYDTIILKPKFTAEKIKFQIPAEEEVERNLAISILDKMPSWVGHCSSPDDRNLTRDDSNEMNRTFGLDVVITGIQQGIFNKAGEEQAIKKIYTICTSEKYYK